MNEVEPTTADPAPPRPGLACRCAKAAALAGLTLALAGLATWATLAVLYADSGTHPRHLRAAAVAAVSLAAIAVVVAWPRRRWWGAATVLVLFAATLAWYFSIPPSNDRDWATDVARCPRAEIDGDRVTLRNVRNFEYRSETDFTPRWEDRTYDLTRVKSADLLLSYWGSDAIAHGMVTFVFDGPEYLAASIETRKEKGESYSAVQGFFRQYELIYVFADERDVVRLRTAHRREQVYLYHTTLTPAHARALLTAYLDRANALAARPEYYNALTSNCVTNVIYGAQTTGASARVTWETLLSGHVDHQAYRNGRLDTRLPFDELRARSRVDPTVPDGPDYSEAIRIGLPDPARPNMSPVESAPVQ